MSYSEILGANNTLVYPASGGGGTQNLEQVLTAGPSANGLGITNLSGVNNAAGPLALVTAGDASLRSSAGNVRLDADADVGVAATVVAGTTPAAISSLVCSAGGSSVVKGADGATLVATAGPVLVSGENGTSQVTVRAGTVGAQASEAVFTGQGACAIKGATTASLTASNGVCTVAAVGAAVTLSSDAASSNGLVLTGAGLPATPATAAGSWAAGTNATRYLKINIGATPYYIPLSVATW